jgi:hypothetical protein
MLITIIAPEIILGQAWSDVDDAKTDLQELQDFAKQDDVPWSMTHSLFANMGGFVIRFNVDRLENSINDTATQTTNQEQSADVQHHDLVSNSSGVGFSNPDMEKAQVKVAAADRAERDNLTQLYSNPSHLNGLQLVELRRSGLLLRLPYITIEEINDKSKSDSLVRLIAVAQIVWTVMQIIVRAVRHLAISQLEIAVIAFAVCAIITYALNWSKPKGVQVPCTLLQYRNEIPDRICALLDKPGEDGTSVLTLLGHIFTRDKQNPGGPLSNHSNVHSQNSNFWGSLVAAMVFGVLHLAAWNFIFPTKTEKILWRVASLFCTAPLLWSLGFFIIALVNELRKNKAPSRWEYFNVIYCFGFIVLYIFARLILIVEIFRTLCFLPLTLIPARGQRIFLILHK